MSRYFLFFINVFFSIISFSQNLVPNPGFEKMKLCPSWSNMNYQSDHLERFCEGWENVGMIRSLSSGGGGQYYHSCAITNGPPYGSGVPRSYNGFQEAHSGNAYVGLASSGGITECLSHYYGIKLIKKLQIGIKYTLSFYVNLADSSRTSTNNLGILLSTQKLIIPDEIQFGNFSLPNKSHLKCEDVILDKKNWIKIEGFLVADSSYEFLTLGNFYDFQKTKISPASQLLYQNFFVDDVTVEETNKRIETEDKVICRGYSSKLLAMGADDAFYWSSNKRDTLSEMNEFIFSPTQSSFVYLVSSNNIDSIFIQVVDPPIKVVPNNFELCEQSFAEINATQNNAIGYFLNSKETQPIFVLNYPGKYLLETIAGNCKRTDTINLSACESRLFVPNAFTPNNDGLNDEFLAIGIQVYNFNMQIYNRWGLLVFTSNDVKEGWKGIDAPANTYFYQISYYDATGTKSFYKKGVFELLR
jgi:gliding motility-associated-like protein